MMTNREVTTGREPSLTAILYRPSSIFYLMVMLILIVATLVPSSAQAQGPIASGETRTGTISTPGASNTWTFSGSAGNAIVVRVGEISPSTFTPKIQLFGPTGTLLGSTAGSSAAEIAV